MFDGWGIRYPVQPVRVSEYYGIRSSGWGDPETEGNVWKIFEIAYHRRVAENRDGRLSKHTAWGVGC